MNPKSLNHKPGVMASLFGPTTPKNEKRTVKCSQSDYFKPITGRPPKFVSLLDDDFGFLDHFFFF